MNSLVVAQKALTALVHDLAQQGLCNERAMTQQGWLALRDKQDYTCIAYSRGRYGTIACLYYLKEDKCFAYV